MSCQTINKHEKWNSDNSSTTEIISVLLCDFIWDYYKNYITSYLIKYFCFVWFLEFRNEIEEFMSNTSGYGVFKYALHLAK